jgi:HD-GYP domain-containing protein (c-di-GMP phosphodiesterase class II)
MDKNLQQDVKDLRGQLLFKGGAHIEEWSKLKVFSQEYLKKKSKFKEVSFFSDDCQTIFSRQPYDKVLRNWTPSFREWLGEIWAPSVLFEELRTLKMLDPYSYQHTLTIAIVGARLLEIWIKANPTVKRSFQALVFHRIGKNRFPEGFLQKQGEISERERRVIFEQPMIGFVLNACYWGDANHLCAKVALQHQEDRLGKGYPFGVETNSLLLDILRLVDRFDALISERPFRFKAFTVREALDLLQEDANAGKMEPDVLRAFVDLLREQRSKDYKKIKFGTIGRPEKPIS